MATARIERRIDGVLTNADTVTLSDAAGTYGIRRVDTGASVVSAGTATTNGSTGVYTYLYTALDESLVYEISWKIVTGTDTEYVTQILHPLPIGKTYIWERLSTIRRRVGDLTGKSKVYGTALAGAAGTVTLQRAKLVADTSLVGKIAYIVGGTGAGDARRISANVQSTGVLTVTPNWTSTPDTTSIVEVWEDGITPERVNGLIALAILDIQKVIPVKVRRNPVLVASDYRSFNLPPEFIGIYRVEYQASDGTWRTYDYCERLSDLGMTDYGWALQGQTVYVSPSLPTDIDTEDIWVRGYQQPAVVATDDELAQMPTHYLTYLTAYMLESGEVRAPAQDTDAHNSRANNFLRLALMHRQNMGAQWEPNTVEVEY